MLSEIDRLLGLNARSAHGRETVGTKSGEIGEDMHAADFEHAW